MTEQFEQVARYPTLREDQRIEARKKARENLIAKLGAEPTYEQFERRTQSKYGPTIEVGILIVTVLFLVAAFLVSAFHVYYVGNSTFREGIDDKTQAIIAGLALVVLSESAVLVLSVIPVMWPMPRTMAWIMYAGAVSAAFIAAIGNIDVTITYTEEPFSWLREWVASFSNKPRHFIMATMPPALTLIIGQGLKYKFLQRAGQREEAKNNYNAALANWDRTVNNLESHELWQSTWASALWDAWCFRKRREVLANITPDEKRAIVAREMAAEQWWIPDGFHAESSGTKVEHGGMRTVTNGKPDERPIKEQVRDALRANPDLLNMPRVEAAQALGVSIGSFQRGVEMYQRNGHSDNGADSARNEGE